MNPTEVNLQTDNGTRTSWRHVFERAAFPSSSGREKTVAHSQPVSGVRMAALAVSFIAAAAARSSQSALPFDKRTTLLPRLPLLRYSPPLVKVCLSCQYSGGPRSLLYIGSQPPPTRSAASPPPARFLFQGACFAPKASKQKKRMRLRGKEEGGMERNEIDERRNNEPFHRRVLFQSNRSRQRHCTVTSHLRPPIPLGPLALIQVERDAFFPSAASGGRAVGARESGTVLRSAGFPPRHALRWTPGGAVLR